MHLQITWWEKQRQLLLTHHKPRAATLQALRCLCPLHHNLQGLNSPEQQCTHIRKSCATWQGYFTYGNPHHTAWLYAGRVKQAEHPLPQGISAEPSGALETPIAASPLLLRLLHLWAYVKRHSMFTCCSTRYQKGIKVLEENWKEKAPHHKQNTASPSVKCSESTEKKGTRKTKTNK